MTPATLEGIPSHTITTLTADELQSLADRLFSRATSALSTYSSREQKDLLLASRALRELLRLYERGVGSQLHCIMLQGGW
jgi:hypothetical protein